MQRLQKHILWLFVFIFSGFNPLAFATNGVAHTLITTPDSYTSQDCVGCHETATHEWTSSDHANAMALPNGKNILADFNNTSVSHYSQKAEFFIEDGIYKAKIIDETNNKNDVFDIKYTFGHYPLQQYLVETHRDNKKGSLHVLPFAWDSRSSAEGGQRWYHNYQDPIEAADRLHWQQPLQNWNGMCADCHSDELKRNYNPTTNTFNTTFSGINVGCVSCHGKMDYQHTKAQNVHPSNTLSQAVGEWVFLNNQTTAVWKSPDSNEKTAMGANHRRDNAFMDTCFACHAVRAPLTDGFKAKTSFLDNFSPQLVLPPFYHADGQIKEEVYVYGSFLQSKMFAAGVNCLDCHNKHTMKLKVEGNGLCLQCHQASKFNVVEHFKHTPDSAGAQCVNCHMTDEVYMGVDKRRDHSFKIPRPHLSTRFDTPNACINCHAEQSNEWAANVVSKWHGEPELENTNQTNLMRLRSGEQLNIQQHTAIINDVNIDTISRASAIEMLPQTTQSLSASHVRTWILHTEPLIRLASARIATLLPPSQRTVLVSPLLKDKFRAIRAAAAQTLVSLQIANADISAYTKAFNELLVSNENSAWRGEGRLNQGNLALQQGDWISAEIAYKGAIQVDPYFDTGYTNLADLYRAKQREDLVAIILTDGIEKVPSSADLVYSFGLHKVRTGELNQAIEQFNKAISLDPQNPQLAYTYALALDGAGKTSQAINKLKKFVPLYSSNSQLLELGLYLAQKHQNQQAVKWFSTYK